VNTIGLTAAALLLHIHPKTLAARAAKGDIPGAKVGRAWVFIEEDLLAFMRGQYVEKVSCPSTSRKGPRSGGRASASPVALGCVGQLDTLIAQRRSVPTTSFGLSTGKPFQTPAKRPGAKP
jgi:hypothetical protein